MGKKIIILAGLVLTLSLSAIAYLYFNNPGEEIVKLKNIRSISENKGSFESGNGRAEYFFRMLRDPKTNSIPASIRHKELEFAKKLNAASLSLKKTPLSNLNWKEAGPDDVGGRTRALAVDVTDPNTIIAGGASGGIWK